MRLEEDARVTPGRDEVAGSCMGVRNEIQPCGTKKTPGRDGEARAAKTGLA
jgi:hypothetical protein